MRYRRSDVTASHAQPATTAIQSSTTPSVPAENAAPARKPSATTMPLTREYSACRVCPRRANHPAATNAAPARDRNPIAPKTMCSSPLSEASFAVAPAGKPAIGSGGKIALATRHTP